jgi:hypothetical protein
MNPAEKTGQYAASVAKIINSPSKTCCGVGAMALKCFTLEFKLQLVPCLSLLVAPEQAKA